MAMARTLSVTGINKYIVLQDLATMLHLPLQDSTTFHGEGQLGEKATPLNEFKTLGNIEIKAEMMTSPIRMIRETKKRRTKRRTTTT